MNRIKFLALVALAFGIFSYGFVAGVYKTFPFDLIKSTKEYILGSGEDGIKPRATIFLEFSPDSEIAMIGDSITQQGLWSEFFPDHRVVNRGVGGDTAADIIERFDTIESTNPEVSFVMVGINDIARGVTPREIADNISVIIELLQEIGSEVVLQNTLECSVNKCGSQLEKIRELNEIIASFPADFGVKLIDINQSLSNDDGLLTEYTYDGVHLNGRGYRVWVDFILSQNIF
jgi:lysophospholipase L1-like esterase